MADELKIDDQQQPPNTGGGNGTATPGDSFFDMSGIVDGEKAKAMNKTAHELNKIVNEGGFAINQEGFDIYTKLCQDFLDGYREHRPRLETLRIKAPMGDFPYADSVSGFNVKVADGNKDALLPNLALMADGYKTMLDVLKVARKNYDEADHEAKKSFVKLNQEEP